MLLAAQEEAEVLGGAEGPTIAAPDQVDAPALILSLELVRQGEIDIRQTETFGPLFMRRRKQTP